MGQIGEMKMRKEYEKAITGEKIFFISEVELSLPFKTDRTLNNWGVLESYKDKLFSLEEIIELTAELYKKQPYILGAMQIEVLISWKVDDIQGIHDVLDFYNYYYETENVDDDFVLTYRNDKKIFVLNEDSVPEYIAAANKEEALKFAGTIWGKDVVEQYFEEYLRDNTGSNYDEFVEDFVRKMADDEEFSLWNDDQGKTIVKTIGEHLKDIITVPSYFASSEY